jgi:hypothetical protein
LSSAELKALLCDLNSCLELTKWQGSDGIR